ncbi:MAG: Mth938-like domain-containing protein [Gammaproteobacteria bacterium]|nr:Mth938-like domain-containing protein [Gammaproteobacteria bacterium]
MKLHLHEFGERNVIRRCQDGTITINEQTYRDSVVVTPDTLVDDWRPNSIEELTANDLGSVAQLGVELVILGTGTRQVFPAAHVLEPLVTAAVGIEVMDSSAAARTYNIVASEGRNVAAAILLA